MKYFFFSSFLIIIIILYILFPYYKKINFYINNFSCLNSLFRIKYYMKDSFLNTIYINENEFLNDKIINSKCIQINYYLNINYYNCTIYKLNYHHLKTSNKSQIFDNKLRNYLLPILDTLNQFNIKNKNLQLMFSPGVRRLPSPFPGIISNCRQIDDCNTIIYKFDQDNIFENIKKIRSYDIDWNQKDNKLIWRGANTGLNNNYRNTLVKNFFNYPNKLIDVGFDKIIIKNNINPIFLKDKLSISEILKSKYVLSVEGDSISNSLKWKLASNSVVFMNKPTYTSWFMEDLLQPNIHYILIKKDFSDLEEKYMWAQNNQIKCQEIVTNANHFVNKFMDLKNEKFIQNNIFNNYFSNVKIISKKLSYENFQNNINLSTMTNISLKNSQNKSNFKIPRLIIKTGIEEEINLSPELQSLFQKIKLENPNFQIVYYSNNKCRDFIGKHFGNLVLNAFDSLKPGSYKADLFRYCVLYIDGGIYGDLTQIYKYPFEKIIDFTKDMFIVKDRIILPYTYPGIQISLIAAKPKMPIFKDAINKIIDNVKKRYYGGNSLAVTGPYLFRNVFESYKNKIDYQMILEETGTSLVFIDEPHLIVVNNKLPNINQILKRNKKDLYGNLWNQRNIYN